MEKNFLIENVEDKMKIAMKSNKVKHTAFYTEQEMKTVEQFLKTHYENQYLLSGGFLEAQRKIALLYSIQFEEEQVKRVLESTLQVIKITLPKELNGLYAHKDYLATLMKLGLERERFGDILVFENGAQVIVLKENAGYIRDRLQEFSRFKKALVEIISINEIEAKEISFQELRIVIASNRLDNFVAELASCSRNQAQELIFTNRVRINDEVQEKYTKSIQIGDIITIRGKGKFIVDSFIGENRKEREIYQIKKYQ